MKLTLRFPESWKDYELIDSGGGEKLERFGAYTLIRPEPQAIWRKTLSEKEWQRRSHARFVREQKDRYRFADDVKGGWTRERGMPESWEISYQYKDLNIRLRLALTSFGHVGIFPEQGSNWNFIFDFFQSRRNQPQKVLNLFAYTGAASVVARRCGADVVHVDASKPGITWANDNMSRNGLKDIRWVHEDALKFVRREVKRGNRYQGIIMDPPPYGRGPDGEKWTLQEKLDELLENASKLLAEEGSFFILSLYAAGLSPLVGYNAVTSHMSPHDPEYGEFYLKSQTGKHLPMGTYMRFQR
ncbi:MAG TPA: class I SAM-dependent methyltransferase [Cyclobacteriaceae bacterium]